MSQTESGPHEADADQREGRVLHKAMIFVEGWYASTPPRSSAGSHASVTITAAAILLLGLLLMVVL